MSSKGEESVPRSMREIVQKRFSEEVIGNAATSGSGWMVLVMDDAATRVISSALTMYDIMEQRVTLVEQLAKSRQPFKEMDVVYIVSPTIESANQISADFENDKKSKYGGVHIYFLDLVISFYLFDLFLRVHPPVSLSLPFHSPLLIIVSLYHVICILYSRRVMMW